MDTKAKTGMPAWVHFLLSAVFFCLFMGIEDRKSSGINVDDLELMIGKAMPWLSGLMAYTGLAAQRRQKRIKQIESDVAKPKDQHGKSRWANVEDAKREGMLNSSGLFLGKLGEDDIFYPGETHLLTVAPPGAGKGVCLSVTNLLLSDRSMVVTDPKGELYAMTAEHRREKMGHEIIVLCPWAKKMSEELEMEIPDHGFNPLSIIKRDSPDAKDEAELLSSLLLPGKAGMDASSEFWNDAGQTVLTAFILHMASRYESYDLPLLRKMLLQSPEGLFDTLVEMEGNDAYEGCLREYGGKLLGTLKNAPQQFEGAMGTAQKALRIYDSASPLAGHVSGGGIDFAAMKDKPTTIYLIMPSDRAATHAAWLRLTISLAIELVGRDRSNRKVLFLLDEFANLGYLPNVLQGMALYRSQGVQVWAIVQQLSQLERLYGKEGLREFIGMSEIVNAFGIWEPETIKVLSDWLGAESIRQFSEHVSPEQNGSSFVYNYNASDFGAPLMRPEDIRTMPSDEQLVFYRNLSPMRARKISYLECKSLRTKAAPNPYYRKQNANGA